MSVSSRVRLASKDLRGRVSIQNVYTGITTLLKLISYFFPTVNNSLWRETIKHKSFFLIVLQVKIRMRDKKDLPQKLYIKWPRRHTQQLHPAGMPLKLGSDDVTSNLFIQMQKQQSLTAELQHMAKELWIKTSHLKKLLNPSHQNSSECDHMTALIEAML